MQTKVSLIMTVRNEAESIDSLIDSICKQELLPNECVCVDACSTDGTWELLQKLSVKLTALGIHVVLLQQAGNRSVGRNKAIETATHEIIVATDVGCILASSWNKNLVKSFLSAPSTLEVVKGWYLPLTTTPFQEAMACYTCVMPDKLNPATFLPSSRSIAFTKSAWRAVGGYPEELDTCEDLVFAQKLEKYATEHMFTMSFAGDAVVYWPQVTNFWSAWKQLYGYAVGDGNAGFVRWQVPWVFVRYSIGVLLVVMYLMWQSVAIVIAISTLLIAYILWTVRKNERYVTSQQAKATLVPLQFIADVAVMVGFMQGSIIRFRRELYNHQHNVQKS